METRRATIMGTFGSMPSLSRLGSIVCVYMLVAPGFSQAQPATGRTDGNPPVARLGRFSTGEPALSRELRNATFAARMKITEEQHLLLNENDMRRREFFRGSGFRGGTPSEEMVAKLKEFDAESVEVLTAEQKLIWEGRKAEIKLERAIREAISPGDSLQRGGDPRSRENAAIAAAIPSTEPALSRELNSNPSFSEKMRITEDQQRLLNEIDIQRMEHFRTLPRGADPASAELETWQASWKAFDPKTTKILTAEQKLIWETRKLEIKTEQANRATNPQATELSNGQRPSTLGRIQSLEEEVKLLKGEVEKLKATIRAVKPEAR
jgi:hypothetical protein